MFASGVDSKPLEKNNFAAAFASKPIEFFAKHVGAFYIREDRRLRCVNAYSYDQPIEQGEAPTNDVLMAQGRRIETSRIERASQASLTFTALRQSEFLGRVREKSPAKERGAEIGCSAGSARRIEPIPI